MKRIIVMIAVVVAMVSCKSTSATSTKIDSKSQYALKGNWTITSVTYPGSEYIKVNSFQIADSKCFEGSSWKFVANNNSGEMAMDKSGCPSMRSPITWFINKEEQFVLKILNAGERAKKVREGYVLSISGKSEDSFQLIDKIDVGGKATDVVYQFQKVSK
jgi:hypothetical protein